MCLYLIGLQFRAFFLDSIFLLRKSFLIPGEGGVGGRAVLEWPHNTAGGGGLTPPPPWTPPPKTKGAIVGQNEIHQREILVGPFIVHTLLGPSPPPPFSYVGGGRLGFAMALNAPPPPPKAVACPPPVRPPFICL